MQEETPRSDRDVQLEQLFLMVCSALDETFSSLQRSALLFEIFFYNLSSSTYLRFKGLSGENSYVKTMILDQILKWISDTRFLILDYELGMIRYLNTIVLQQVYDH